MGRNPAALARRALLLCSVILVLIVAAPARAEEMQEREHMLVLNNQAIRYAVPYGYDIQAARKLGLSDDTGFTEDYFRLQAVYAQGLFEYLDSLLSLRALDKSLETDEMRFMPCPDEERDMYQHFYSFGLRYLYLRNNVCIERLSEDELRKLRGAADGEAPSTALIAGTWKTVTAGSLEYGDEMGIIYNTANGDRAPNYSLVLCLKTVPEYDEKDNYANPGHEDEKKAFLTLLRKELEQRLTELLQYPVRVFLRF